MKFKETNQMSRQSNRLVIGLAAAWMLATAAIPALAAEQKTPQIAGVDNTRMGAYRALAQLSFQSFIKGDVAMAAELARILERTWDAAEEGGGPSSLAMKNKDLFEQLDQSMDNFIKPVMHYAAKAPDAIAVKAAYDDFLEKLKQGDESAKKPKT
jgi:hypothetical protein